MFKDLCYTYDLDIENLDEMLMHVHNTSHPVSYTHLDVYKRQDHEEVVEVKVNPED